MIADLDLASPIGQTIALAPEVLLSIAALGVLLVVSWRHSGPRDSRVRFSARRSPAAGR